MSKIRIAIAGPRGKMGKQAVHYFNGEKEMELVSVLDRQNDGKQLSSLEGFKDIDVPIFTDMKELVEKTKPDCLIDLTTPEAVVQNTKKALSLGIRTIVGTTGLTDEELFEIETIANERKIGCIIAPNFSIGGILMMKFSQIASRYFNQVEIIEMHHPQKKDVPSGTSIKTAKLIAPNLTKTTPVFKNGNGTIVEGIPIHSVRLAGKMAHQEVIFGDIGQTLTIRHDTIDRTSYMVGISLAIQHVMQLDHFVFGLEHFINEG